MANPNFMMKEKNTVTKEKNKKEVYKQKTDEKTWNIIKDEIKMLLNSKFNNNFLTKKSVTKIINLKYNVSQESIQNIYKKCNLKSKVNLNSNIEVGSLTCSKCGKTKSKKSFYKNFATLTGYMSICKKCHSNYSDINSEIEPDKMKLDNELRVLELVIRHTNLKNKNDLFEKVKELKQMIRG